MMYYGVQKCCVSFLFSALTIPYEAPAAMVPTANVCIAENIIHIRSRRDPVK